MKEQRFDSGFISSLLPVRPDTLQNKLILIVGIVISVFWIFPKACDPKGGLECRLLLDEKVSSV